MKAIPHFLVASALLIGSACSSSTETTGGTTGGDTSANTSVDATSGGAGTGASSTGTDTNTASGTGTDTGTGAGNGSDPSTGTTNQVGVSSGSRMAEGGTGTGGTGTSTDMTAFMGTFATMQDAEFLLAAASSNMLEIQAGQTASQRSTNADVKKFGQMMVSHHTKATQELKAVATPLGVTMPTTLMPVHQAMLDRLNNKSGKDFDEAYMDMMEAAHKMDIAMFEVKSKAAQKPSVQALATKTLPMLRSHHTMADGLEKKVD